MLKRIVQKVSIPELSSMAIEWSRRRITSHQRTVPDFLIIGAQRCGTTSLYNYMVKHPSIIPAFRKEIHFFDRSYRNGIGYYRTFFPLRKEVEQNIGERKITGEATPIYLFHPWVAKRVYTWLPKVKLIILLRNPVDRAYSHYQMNIRLKIEDRAFEEAIEREFKEFPPDKTEDIWLDKRKANAYAHYSYINRGLYISQIQQWLNYFPKEQFLFLKSEDFFLDPLNSMKTVFGFLELKDYKNENIKPHNAGTYNALPANKRIELEEYFKPFNQKLYEMIGTDIAWESNK